MPPNTSAPHKDRAEARPGNVRLQCEDCAQVFTRDDQLGTPRCPRCGSVRGAAVQRQVGGSVVPASSSLDEDRFARVALWGELITSEQFAQCVDAQRELAEAGRDVPSLATLLIQAGHLDREQAEAIYRVMTTRSPEQWRNQFGQIALRKGMVTEAQLREALETQTKLVVGQGQAPFLGHLLVERGYMAEPQVQSILKAQARRHIGMLHQLRSQLRPSSRKLGDLLRRVRRPLLVAAFVGAIAAAGVLGAWVHAYATGPATFDTICDHCGHRAEAPMHALAEPCSRCGQGTLCTPLWCSKCRVAFPLKVHTSEQGEPWVEPCPVCRSLDDTDLPAFLEGLGAKPGE
ncbi:MAG: hypothetical protein ACOC8A_00370 [bacterium]